MGPIGIRPTVDFAFKRIFGNPEHPEITIHFLNAFLSGEPRITSVELLNPHLEKEIANDKFAVLDLLARDEHGRLWNVEMQTTVSDGLAQRLTYYAASLYSGRMVEGEQYKSLRPVICLCVLDGVLFPKAEGFHLDFRLRNERNRLTLTNDMQIHLLELPKLPQAENNIVTVSDLENWASFLIHAAEMTPEEVAKRYPDPAFTSAAGILTMISQTPSEKLLYEARLKARRDEASWLAEAREEGLAKGLSQGEVIGRIHLLQEMTGGPLTSREELAAMSADALQALEESLRKSLASRNNGS